MAGEVFAPCTMTRAQRAAYDVPAEVVDKCNQWLGVFYQSEIDALAAKGRFYDGQLAIAQQGFWIVAAICIAGLVFSAWQLWRATTLTDSEIEIGMQSIKIRSAYIGIVVLVLSLAFFFIFFTQVFTFAFGEAP